MIKLTEEQKARLIKEGLPTDESWDSDSDSFLNQLRRSDGDGYYETDPDSVQYAVENYVSKRLRVCLLLLFDDLDPKKIENAISISEKLC